MNEEIPEPTDPTDLTRPADLGVGPAQRLLTEVDLARWASFIHQGESSRTTLWLLLLDGAGRSLPELIAIDDVEPGPHPVFIANLLELVEMTLATIAPGGSMVAMLERPGTPHRTPADREWNEAVRWEARQRGIPVQAFFVACAGRILPMTLDDAA
ncbi:hypothetical protein IM660_06125 [Ruania alkalisoli]|uniref:RadC-like JAB domain-containing protein n=1 Tax=Ruania alkalisoli TaxID=2779775 RepID=A0A7M1SW74_9MICO|nr:hypothetical protein [Ruania alkalisoli]QOR71840.1 hypothetical protein IM660_06125 [Ruania alkalisoli]